METFFVYRGMNRRRPCGVVKAENRDSALEKVAQHLNGEIVRIRDVRAEKHVQVGSESYYVTFDGPEFLILN